MRSCAPPAGPRNRPGSRAPASRSRRSSRPLHSTLRLGPAREELVTLSGRSLPRGTWFPPPGGGEGGTWRTRSPQPRWGRGGPRVPSGQDPPWGGLLRVLTALAQKDRDGAAPTPPPFSLSASDSTAMLTAYWMDIFLGRIFTSDATKVEKVATLGNLLSGDRWARTLSSHPPSPPTWTLAQAHVSS